MRVAVSLALVIAFFGSGNSQSASAELKRSQNELKKALRAAAPSVNSLSFEGCRLSIKTGTSARWSENYSSLSSRTGYFNDEPRFSTGPDTLVSERYRDHYVLDFSLLDPTRITMQPSFLKDSSIVEISDTRKGVITPKKENSLMERFWPGRYRIVVRANATERVLGSFTDLARLCNGN